MYSKAQKEKKKRKKTELPTPIPLEVPRFDLEDDSFQTYLEENGFAVIKNVASENELEYGINLAWEYIEKLGHGISRRNKESWNTQNWPDPMKKGIIAADGVGHSDFLWYVRSLPNVKEIFSKVWDTDDLITSFDGFCFFRASEYNKDWLISPNLWYHVDQNYYLRPEKEGIQGFLNFYESGPTDGGFVVIPRSHLHFEQIFKKRPKLKFKSNYVAFWYDKYIWEEEMADLQPIKICIEPGDFVIWDSRTIHCNTPPTADRPLPESDYDLLPPRRIVAYVCMIPSNRISFDLQYRRIDAYMAGFTTSHWPDERYDNPRKENQISGYLPPSLSLQQKQLICGNDFPYYF